jgi:hypothetical protein
MLSGDMYMDQLGALAELITQGKPNWKLVRLKNRDSLTKHSVDILWIEWNEDGTFKEKHDICDWSFIICHHSINFLLGKQHQLQRLLLDDRLPIYFILSLKQKIVFI